ncbi:hypothetical protein CPT_Phriendly_032 [Vibrio phage Phriendly]|nr:hypothetical protein CPT_Phriendly_032 [Vibrio phage Phriendly]
MKNYVVHTKRTLDALPDGGAEIRQLSKVKFKYKRGDIVYHCFMF